MSADGGNVRQLTGVEPDADTYDEGPTWSPDGHQLAFTSGPDNLHGDIHIMNADGSNVRRITFNDAPGTNMARDESPDWQPIPIGEDLRAVGDVATLGPGAYSVHVGGRGLSDVRARLLAARWAALTRGPGPEPPVRLRLHHRGRELRRPARARDPAERPPALAVARN